MSTVSAMKYKSVAKSKRRSRTVYHLLMILFSLLMLYPFFWLIGSSFKPNEEIFSNVGSLIPKNFTAENYKVGWKGFGGLSFGVFFGNSLFISTVFTIGTVVSSAIVAFDFARLRFKGRGIWFIAMMITMMMPNQILMIPRYVLFNKIGWVGTQLPLTIPRFFSAPFDTFLIMQFIRGIPRDLDEAARIDGCNWYTIFLKIIVPLIVPSLVTVGVLAFIYSWGDFMSALLYLNKPEMYTAAYALKLHVDVSSTDYGAAFAMSVVSLVPLLILFIIPAGNRKMLSQRIGKDFAAA